MFDSQVFLFKIYFNILTVDRSGIGDWGLGIGDWAQSPIPNPQSPIPNPQSPIPNPHSQSLKRNLRENYY